MGFAEKKVELFEIVVNADEEMTGQLIEFAKKLNKNKSKFTEDELAKFHATRNKYLTKNNKTILLEEAHAYIRSLSLL